MSNPKIKVNRKLQKEATLHEKNNILKEINKFTASKGFTACPIQRVVVKRSVPEFSQGVSRKDSSSRCKAFRSQASQTALGEANDYEGVVRYPSSRVLDVKPKKEVGLQVEQQSPFDLREDVPIKRIWSSVNHVKVNQVPVIKPRLIASNKRLDPLRAPPTYQRGIVPKYLQKLKENEDKPEYLPRKLSPDVTLNKSDMMEREEKLQKLASWHESYKQMVSELNELSVAS